MDTIRVAERTQRALRYGYREARRVGAPALTLEHLLLGLLNDGAGEVGPGVVSGMFETLGIPKALLENTVRGPLQTGVPLTEDFRVSLSPDVPKALEIATNEARAFGHDYVGAEHLLLGVIQSESPASVLLAEAGLDAERARTAIRRILGDAA